MNNYKHCEAVDFKINKSFENEDSNHSFNEQQPQQGFFLINKSNDDTSQNNLEQLLQAKRRVLETSSEFGTKSNLKKRAISSDLNQELYEKLLSMKPPRITKTAALVENFFEAASK
jgi:hypothetical protein